MVNLERMIDDEYIEEELQRIKQLEEEEEKKRLEEEMKRKDTIPKDKNISILSNSPKKSRRASKILDSSKLLQFPKGINKQIDKSTADKTDDKKENSKESNINKHSLNSERNKPNDSSNQKEESNNKREVRIVRKSYLEENKGEFHLENIQELPTNRNGSVRTVVSNNNKIEEKEEMISPKGKNNKNVSQNNNNTSSSPIKQEEKQENKKEEKQKQQSIGKEKGKLSPPKKGKSLSMPKKSNMVKKKSPVKDKVKVKIEEKPSEIKTTKYSPLIHLEDLILLDNSIKEDLSEIQMNIFRNLRDLRILYNSIKTTSEKEKEDFRNFKMNKASQSNKLGGGRFGRGETKNFMKINPLNPIEPVQVLETLELSDLYYTINLRDLWKFLIDYDLYSLNFTFCEFDRLISRNISNNEFADFQIPNEIKEDKDIYNYQNYFIHSLQVKFVWKYKKNIDFYYQYILKKPIPDEIDSKKILSYHLPYIEEEKKETNLKLIYPTHYENQPIFPLYFHEILVRLSFVLYKSYSNLSLSSKMKKLFDSIFIFKKKMNKSSNRSSTSKFENSIILKAEEKNKLFERNFIEEYLGYYKDRMDILFKKIFILSKQVIDENDEAISHEFFYEKLLKRSKFFKRIITNKKKYLEMVLSLIKEKPFIGTEPEKSQKVLDKEFNSNIFKLYDNEFIPYEFYQYVFYITKLYHNKQPEKLEKDDFEIIIKHLEDLCVLFSKKKSIKYEYFYPITTKIIKKEELLRKLYEKEMEELRKKKEKERINKERHNMSNENVNVFIQNDESDEDDDDEDEDE